MDYELSPDPERDELLAREHSSVHEAIGRTLAQLDINRYLSAGGVSSDKLAVIRKKLLG